MRFTGEEPHDITLEQARELTRRYREQTKDIVDLGGAFGRGIIDRILKHPDCVGIRYYHGIHADGRPTVVLVGIDANGDDLVEGSIAEEQRPCPPYCASETKSLPREAI